MLNVKMEIRAVLLLMMQPNARAKLTNYYDNVADVYIVEANALTMG